MTAAEIALAHTLCDLPDAAPEVQRAIGADLLYALGLLERPDADGGEAS